jgi:hypothetical protein
MSTIKLLIKYALLIGGMIFWFFVFVNYLQPNEVAYDCRLAEISPDFPPEVRNECRKMMKEYVKPIST